ncbi:trans-aconitate methyltransferase [Actinokineospora baliensis]|uniref:class I SAM-dependent methyltransferase n=1 Tax=Actinokineospora baliensis TaxID=547056 RepID=UPI00195D91B2|nr:class I SAM-dependent methyltransferase [Actinokineospora baliensis]MBM7775552.1 trans-aconitate methyltransferase [Actinokineospora baliensis]
MGQGFSGEVADYYDRYRRGYPAEAIDAVVRAFELDRDDVAIDLGCGTGQVAVPLASRVRAVVGLDPEPDMLLRAAAHAAPNASWMIGRDVDLPALRALTGPVGVVTVGQTLHWMDHPRLFAEIPATVRPGGGVAVLTNGTPLWLQETEWSRALRSVLEEWLSTPLTAACGTDEGSQQRYLDAMAEAGLACHRFEHTYSAPLALSEIVGGVFSALSVDRLPGAAGRAELAERVERALGGGPFEEFVRVTVLVGRVAEPGFRTGGARR